MRHLMSLTTYLLDEVSLHSSVESYVNHTRQMTSAAETKSKLLSCHSLLTLTPNGEKK